MTSPASHARRLLAIDVLRVVAVLQMVNGHTIDTVLEEAERHSSAFSAYSYARGLTSVAFLVAAGFAYHATTYARYERHRADPSSLGHRFGRAKELLLVGFGMHVPVALAALAAGDREGAVVAFFRVEILPCIGVSILALELITRLTVDVRVARAIAAALGLALIGFAPLAALAPTAPYATPLTAWFTPNAGSLFPLFPWGGYLMLAAALGGVVFPAGARTRVLVTRTAVATLSALLASRLLLHFEGAVPSDVGRSAHPYFVFEKLAWVFAFVSVLSLLTARVRALPRPVQMLSESTLTVYVVHLVLLFATPLSPHHLFHRALPLSASLLVSVCVVGASIGLTLAWPGLRRELGERLRRHRGAETEHQAAE